MCLKRRKRALEVISEPIAGVGTVSVVEYDDRREKGSACVRFRVCVYRFLRDPKTYLRPAVSSNLCNGELHDTPTNARIALPSLTTLRATAIVTRLRRSRRMMRARAAVDRRSFRLRGSGALSRAFTRSATEIPCAPGVTTAPRHTWR